MGFGLEIILMMKRHDNFLILYQVMLQNTQNLHQPIPKQVRQRESIYRGRVEADAGMMQDYFNDGCTWGPKKLHGRLGQCPHMKTYAIMKCLYKGIPPDRVDDYTCMSASTIYYYIKNFCDAIMFGFNAKYMRHPSVNDTKWFLKENAARGFPGMLRILDCMHWGWRVCPMGNATAYTGHKSYLTCVLEEVASYDRWFWHGHFGVSMF
ncbi:uncharacterized protein LOC113290911 [Papaver somniferum]|uniref:uncharacterized protein LOC113290911 n=1 Tax=Papaver somniferum TaxID=3469 RepID=UPI000E6FB9CA|nr:uncharacterized protein LOC113290911 [Papaver somniferum]